MQNRLAVTLKSNETLIAYIVAFHENAQLLLHEQKISVVIKYI